MKGVRYAVPFIVVLLVYTFTGCTALPGKRPFKEEIFSESEAMAAYKGVTESLLKEEDENWGSYAVKLDSDRYNGTFSFWNSEKYTAAYAETASGEYLWYQECLYRRDKDRITYREMEWEELMAGTVAEQMWDLTGQLLKRADADLTYKYVPMAEDRKYLLKAKYPEMEFDSRKIRPEFTIYMDEDGTYDHFCTSWSEIWGYDNFVNHELFSIVFYPYPGSEHVDAERALWSFGYDCGLTDEHVPALSEQKDNREWSREIVADMDFKSLKKRAKEERDLVFPYPLEGL